MGPIEIIIIIALVLIFGSMIGVYVYKKVKKIPTNTCNCGVKKLSKEKLIDEYRKTYKNTNSCSPKDNLK